IYNYVPQTQLLPEVDVFITHAGFNSTSEGMASGAAMVLVPQAVDQFDVARVVEKLGAGIALNKHEVDITTDMIRKAVDDAYNNRDSFKEGVKKIIDSFADARNDREAIYAEVFA
ncbi:glycosyltransferase, partial [Ruminococcus flavefaciens]|uniref:glycosyltransferase n=1 Tax=Ruminococcus flavefaciens TaxID=1265 RepID=UPI0026F2CFE8